MNSKSTQRQEDIKNAFTAFNQGHVREFDSLLSIGTVSWKDLEPETKSPSTLIEKVLIHGPSLVKKSPYSNSYTEPLRAPFLLSLMKNGWDAKRPLPNGRLPIHQVLLNGKLDLAQCLVNQNVPINEADTDGHSVLYRAVVASRMSGQSMLSISSEASDAFLKHLFQRGAKFVSEDEEKEAFQMILTGKMFKILKLFQNDWVSFKPNLPLKVSKRCYAPTLFWGAVRYGFITKADDVEMWAISGADATVTDGHKKGVLHALLEGIENREIGGRTTPAHYISASWTKNSGHPLTSPSFEWTALQQLGPVLVELGKMGARWTKKKKLGNTAFEKLEALVSIHDPKKEVDHADLEKAFGEQIAYTIRAQSTREKLEGLPQADEVEEEKPVRISKRRL